MALLETWRTLAYGDGLDDKKKEELRAGYFQIEKGIYEQILSNPEEVVTGTVKELAEKCNAAVRGNLGKVKHLDVEDMIAIYTAAK